MLKVFLIIWITAKRHVMMIALAIFIIYFSTCGVVKAEPCVIKSIPFWGWQEISKLTNGGIKNCEFGFEKCDNITNGVNSLFRPFDWIGVETREFNKNLASKSGGSLVKFILPISVFAQEVSSNATNERTNNTKSSRNICYFKGSKFQFYLYSFFGGFISISIHLSHSIC